MHVHESGENVLETHQFQNALQFSVEPERRVFACGWPIGRKIGVTCILALSFFWTAVLPLWEIYVCVVFNWRHCKRHILAYHDFSVWAQIETTNVYGLFFPVQIINVNVLNVHQY